MTAVEDNIHAGLVKEANRYRAAVKALDGQLGDDVLAVVWACKAYADSVELLDESFDCEGQSLPMAVERLMGIKADHEALLADGDPACDAAEDAGELGPAAALVARCNELAGAMTRWMGWNVPAGHEFHLSESTQDNWAWRLSAKVLEHLEGHEMADALSEVLEASQFPAGSPFAAPTAKSAKDDRNG